MKNLLMEKFEVADLAEISMFFIPPIIFICSIALLIASVAMLIDVILI